MLVEIRGAGFINKGAELMLHAVIDALSRRFDDVEFALRASGRLSAAPYISRARAGLHQKAFLPVRGKDYGEALAFLPKKLRDAYGIKVNSDVDVVIDISGFAYGDQWSTGQANQLHREALRRRKNGRRIYLLPQALGPFVKGRQREAAIRAFECCDLIYARESVSFAHLEGLGLARPQVAQAPDFTNLLVPAKSLAPLQLRGRFCIIPNAKMIEKTDRSTAVGYIKFLENLYRAAEAGGHSPFLLLHEKNDASLARELAKLLPEIEIHAEDDPLVIKAIIGASHVVFSSRFHGLVSALSQAVPALGTSWSHKYRMLFADYEFEDGLIDTLAVDRESLDHIVESVAADSANKFIRKSLKVHSTGMKKAATQMWDQVAADIRTSIRQ